MPRFKLTIEYAGTRYSGWQIQKNARTVQGELDRAIRSAFARGDKSPARASARLRSASDRVGNQGRASVRLRGEGADFEFSGAGRTDAGVHALAQVAHLELYTHLDPEQVRRQLNDELPADIHVRAVDRAPHRFHARHDAVSRSYLYQISRRRTAFGKPFVWWIREPLDTSAMRRSAGAFEGMRDFRGFTDDDPSEKSTVVLVDRVSIAEQGPLILIRIQGSHFLWKMVRRIVGVMAAVGRGEIPPEAVRDPGIDVAALTAPAAGLFLEGVYYEGDPGPGPIRPLLNLD
jgi:tRNA pseudouridine38-40 synthase